MYVASPKGNLAKYAYCAQGPRSVPIVLAIPERLKRKKKAILLYGTLETLFTKGDSPDSALVRHLTVLSCNTAAYFHVYKPLEKSLKCQ